ncbi:hypothetical protein EDB87DRAFT_983033 [Lactarius vividus]|nr:hypothetical protein EDB87DRAFT_983033 [Lactarius vividus]
MDPAPELALQPSSQYRVQPPTAGSRARDSLAAACPCASLLVPRLALHIMIKRRQRKGDDTSLAMPTSAQRGTELVLRVPFTTLDTDRRPWVSVSGSAMDVPHPGVDCLSLSSEQERRNWHLHTWNVFGWGPTALIERGDLSGELRKQSTAELAPDTGYTRLCFQSRSIFHCTSTNGRAGHELDWESRQSRDRDRRPRRERSEECEKPRIDQLTFPQCPKDIDLHALAQEKIYKCVRRIYVFSSRTVNAPRNG